MKKRKRTMKSNLCRLALWPLICLGTATLVIACVSIYTAMAAETRDGLGNLAYALYQVCDATGEGDFELSGGVLTKGGQAFDADFTIVDRIKEASGVDATIFYGDTRMLTSVRYPNGTRAVGTHASPEVVRTVLERGENYFSRKVSVNETPYFGCYIPLQNGNGDTVGMLFVGKTRKMVMDAVGRTILWIFLMVAAVSAAAALISMTYARKIVYSLDKTKEFLGGIARGNIDEEIDPEILSREDEIGEMGNFALDLKLSINELVSTDPLTGLHNRRICEILLPNIIREYERYQTPAVVAIGDIDFFKNVNDTYGHQAGDAVLKELAVIFREHMERKGIIVRWGGEEFLFIYERMTLERVRFHLEELLELVRASKICYNGVLIPVTMTFGAAACKQGSNPATLTKEADDNLYYGKKNGRNQVVVSRPSGAAGR